MHALVRFVFLLLLTVNAFGCAIDCTNFPTTTAIIKTIGTESSMSGGGGAGGGGATHQACEGEVVVTCNGKRVPVAPMIIADWGCSYLLSDPCSYKVTVTHEGKTETQSVEPETDECGVVTQTLCFFGSCDEAM